jgi:hypothetical protein
MNLFDLLLGNVWALIVVSKFRGDFQITAVAL